MKSFGSHYDQDLPELADERSVLGRSLVDWFNRIAGALLVLGLGWVSSALVPLLAVACDTCQDGIRNPRFSLVMMALAYYAVPAAALATAVGILLPRLSARVVWISGGVLGVLLVAVFVLGQIPA
ncbi:hypothetical protein [Streptomyces sp. YIM S03343]